MTTYKTSLSGTVPFVDYQFRVKATNQHGMGEWSMYSAAAQFNKAPDDSAAVMSHTGAGQFTVTNFNGAMFDYTGEILTGGGSATLDPATGVFTLTPENASMVVHTTYKGVPWDAVDLRVTGNSCERRKITYNRCEYVQTGWHQTDGPCAPGCTCYGTCGPGSGNCGCSEGYTQCGLEDHPPGGFTKKHGEWGRVW